MTTPRAPSPPPLPKDAPPELVAFVACRGDRADLVAGRARWLPSPPGLGGLLAPRVTIEPADDADAATVTIGWSLAKVRLNATVADGRLLVQGKGTPVPLLRDVYAGIEVWVTNLNEWLAANGRRLGPPDISTGRMTLVKQRVADA